MISSRTALFICTVLFLAVNSQCKKDRIPKVYGQWETLSAVGFEWEYDITKNGQFCRTLPDYFNTWFCFPYDQNRDTLFVHAANEEIWVWEFEGNDVAVVDVYGQGPQRIKLVLRRTK